MDEHAQRAARTYSSAADHYNRPALAFWDFFGATTVARLPLAPGQLVLDLCCGAGASAIPAARTVGARGRVLGVDLAAPLLALARARAARESLTNLEFRQVDATRTGLASGTFDAVVCVFGVFFASDMAAFIAEMWRLVRPGGVLAVTTWGPDLFEPANTVFWEAVRQLEPSLFKSFNPWDEITTTEALLDLFTRAGVAGGSAQAMSGAQRLGEPAEFWDVVLGSGYRATVDALTAEQRDTLRATVLASLRSNAVTSIRTDVVFGTVTRPAP